MKLKYLEPIFFEVVYGMLNFYFEILNHYFIGRMHRPNLWNRESRVCFGYRNFFLATESACKARFSMICIEGTFPSNSHRSDSYFAHKRDSSTLKEVVLLGISVQSYDGFSEFFDQGQGIYRKIK